MNGDGTKDLVAGCFQGFAHYLKGLPDGNFEKEVWLTDVDGKDIHMGQYWGVAERKWIYVNQVEGVGNNNILVYPDLFDWDNDGDLDLVMGGRRGNVGLRLNEGSASEPKFSPTQKFLEADGGYISLKRQVSIEMADLDDDGLADLVCATDERIVWYKNSGTREAPKFTTPETIAEVTSKGPKSYLCVTSMDYNGDGRTDLIIGAKDVDRKGGYWVYTRAEGP